MFPMLSPADNSVTISDTIVRIISFSSGGTAIDLHICVEGMALQVSSISAMRRPFFAYSILFRVLDSTAVQLLVLEKIDE